MKKLVLLLLLSRCVYADSFSLGIGVTTVSDQPGYAAQITSPFLFGRLAIQLSGGQNFIQGKRYTLAEFGLQTPLYRSDQFKMLFKGAIERFFADEIASETMGGLHYTLAGEFALNSKLAILAEAGYSLPFLNVATKLPGRPTFGQGISFLIGPKLYF